MENQTNNKGLFNSVSNLKKSFGPTEKLIFYILSCILVVSALVLLAQVNDNFLVEVPAAGGVLREGLVGSPRFVNPVLAISDTDKAISSLVYSGLLKLGTDGKYVPDLAESYSVSDDGLSYYFKIRDDAKFQDGTPVTADDVIFTVNKAQDPAVKSPRAASWDGVTMQKTSAKEIVFTLKKPYSPFLESLTMGILPQHIWQEVTSEEFPFSKWNTEPIGSGPYSINTLDKNSDGIPTDIKLKASGDVKISNIEFYFYQNDTDLLAAYKAGSIDSAVPTDAGLSSDFQALGAAEFSPVMPRVFGAFFNQNQAQVLSNIEVRKALDMSLNKQEITDQVLQGLGVPLSGPVPDQVWNSGTSTDADRIAAAKDLLIRNGWALNKDGIMQKKGKTTTYTLQFSISTADVAELKTTAGMLADTWNKLGAQVDVKIFTASDLNQNVIRPRKYDVLLFGEIIDQGLDLYPFWHSSERNDPGLNISMYANINADKLLEAERAAKDQATKDQQLALVEAEINKDIPAVFLYAPKYLYAISPKVKAVNLPASGAPSERFANIGSWYINTEKIWKIFQKN